MPTRRDCIAPALFLLICGVPTILDACATHEPAAAPPAPVAQSAPGAQSAPAVAENPFGELQQRIAHGLIERSPSASPSDLHARDAAGDALAHFADLQDALGDNILWGGFDPAQGYDPARCKLTAFNPFVWSKLYLSTFMFSEPVTVKADGPRTILEVGARFRSGLDAGDYPYPFWHSAKKWQAYLDTRAVVLVFEDNIIVAGYRKVEPDPGRAPANRKWDGHWQWEDAAGHPQPRVSLYTYLFSPKNPHVASLDKAYRALASRFRAQECLTCHSPDNTAQVSKLYMLNFPNQALTGRHELLSVLSKDSMPPLDDSTGRGAGLHDESTRASLYELARVFAAEGDAALAFEHTQGR
jgi:hypothetical protein